MADTTIETSAENNLDYRAIRAGPVWVDEDTGYVFFINSAFDIRYRKTTNGGSSWGSSSGVITGTFAKFSIWFDKWTPGDSGTLIHIAGLDSNTDDIFYVDLDTSDDSLGTKRTVFAGANFNTGNWTTAAVDITKARGGNLYIGFWADTSGEKGFYRSTDAGVNWTSRAEVADGNAIDGILLLPGNEADNQDIWCIYWDKSANEITLKVYDDSNGASGSWDETVIGTSMTEGTAFYNMSASIRHSDGHLILAAWSAYDTTAADFKVWDINGSGSIVAKANILTDSANTAAAAMLINQQNDDIYVAYTRGSFLVGLTKVFFKKSTDGGGAWGSEQTYSEAAEDDNRGIWAGISVMDDGGKFQPMFFNDDLDDLFVNVVNDVEIAAAVEGETRSLAGDQPAATGILARIEQGLRALAGDQPSASGILTHDAAPTRAMAGDQPAPSGVLVRIEQALRALAGNQPAAIGVLTRVFGRPRSVAGTQPAATGILTRVEQALRALTGDQPTPTGILASVWEGVRALAGVQPSATGTLAKKLSAFKSLTGDQPTSTGTLTRIEKALRALAGSQPAATGTLVAVKTTNTRDVAGDQPTATGILTRIEKAVRAVTGNQPAATGVLSTLGTFARALTGSQPSAAGALARSKAFSESLTGDQPAATGSLSATILEAELTPVPPDAYASLDDAIVGARATVSERLVGASAKENIHMPIAVAHRSREE